MTSHARDSASARLGNLGAAERWLSLLGGLGLLLTTARGSTAGRIARGAVGLSLLARGAAGHCAMKAALTGESSMAEGLKEQWRRLTSPVESVLGELTPAEHIDNMATMYELELQELYSAELQQSQVANDLARTMGNAELAFRLQEYATELQARRSDLKGLLTRVGADPREHVDDAMQALLDETEKMWRICAGNVRDAAVTASFQRIIHYKIAGYGTIAAYAKALGRTEESAHFAQLADRDKAIDQELSELAKGTLNPEATASAVEEAPHEPTAQVPPKEQQSRPH